jgi:Ni,Fe-hydrogenase III large subunit/Ni,Fe-hydrogenase III component G
MHSPGLDLALTPLPAPLPIWHGTIDAAQWSAAAAAVAEGGGRLVSLWGSDRDETGNARSDLFVCAAYALAEGLVWLDLVLPAGDTPRYPDVSRHFPAASRMQRACADLLGIEAEGADDHRPWLDHSAWPRRALDTPSDARWRPLRRDAGEPDLATATDPGDYDFVRVEGDGVHEIAVGPVHAGTIEPGHFRFSAVGEKVLRLEQRLGYTHKGIERRFTELAPLDAYRLAARISGDSTVAFGWAYCMALESTAGCTLPARAAALRALLLERERVANHLGDIGALGNDAAFGFGLAQFSRLREDWLRASHTHFGHRLTMDVVLPGGVGVDPDAAALDALHAQCDAIEAELDTLRRIYDDHAGLQDRFIGTGTVTPELARQIGLAGLAGRASGQAADLRCDHPWSPYDTLGVQRATQQAGDVASRVAVRFEETFESLRLIRRLCKALPDGPVRVDLTLPGRVAFGAGWVEGWRGEVFVALELDDAARIRRCHCHDPSWQNWPAVMHAAVGNIVADFPLINKSFNLAYSGHDL